MLAQNHLLPKLFHQIKVSKKKRFAAFLLLYISNLMFAIL